MSAEQPDHIAEIPLPSGRVTEGIARRGGEVLRPLGPWSDAVHGYLRHLESAGFTGAPRVLGVDGPREIITFIEGDVPLDPLWQPGHGHRLPAYARSEAALVAAGRLVRRLHDAARGYTPANTEYRYHPHPPREGEVVSHGDLGPWNTVYRGGVPVAFIDWDAAGPVEPSVAVAAAAWAFVPLVPAEQLREAGFEPALDIGIRLRLFVDAYGLDDPRAILPALRRSLVFAVERVMYGPATTSEAADVLESHARELRWLHSVESHLDNALSA